MRDLLRMGLLAAGFALPAFAQGLSTSTPPPPMLAELCKDAKSLAEGNTCMEEASATIKREFNRYFAKLAASVSDDKAKQGLRLAQDRWNEYRDKSCGAAFDFYSSGVMRAIMERTCEVQLTRSRMADLEVIYRLNESEKTKK